jgi:F-type H+-transporting ATPase subunit b
MIADSKEAQANSENQTAKSSNWKWKKKCSYGWIKSFYLSLSIAEKLLKDELSNKEAQTKLVEKC